MPESKVVLVTGASSGLGRETAILLSQHGFQVFGASRKPSAQEAGPGYAMLQLDVDSDESVNNCVNTMLDKTGRLEVLVNNAGYLLTGGGEETSVDEAKAQFETNFFGAVRMVRAVLPVMRKQGSGQIINVSSLAAKFSFPFQGHYAATKAALLAYSQALRYEVESFGVRVSVVEPGLFRTNIAQTRRIAKDPIGDYDQMRHRVTKLFDDEFQKGSDPKLVAGMILRIIESESPRLEYLAGIPRRYRALNQILPQGLIQRLIESVVRRRLKPGE